MANADCLLDIAEDVTDLPEGAEIEAWELD
jgi:hypothetical protein